MRQASSSGARLAVILGDDELREQRATVKNLAGGDQESVPFADLATYLGPAVSGSNGKQEAAS
jgi:histidyl-tRNA synthetase